MWNFDVAQHWQLIQALIVAQMLLFNVSKKTKTVLISAFMASSVL